MHSRHTAHPTLLDSPLAISYKNHQKNLAYLSHLAPLTLFFFTKKQSQKERGHGTMPPPLNTLQCTEYINILIMTKIIFTPFECNKNVLDCYF